MAVHLILRTASLLKSNGIRTDAEIVRNEY